MAVLIGPNKQLKFPHLETTCSCTVYCYGSGLLITSVLPPVDPLCCGFDNSCVYVYEKTGAAPLAGIAGSLGVMPFCVLLFGVMPFSVPSAGAEYSI